MEFTYLLGFLFLFLKYGENRIRKEQRQRVMGKYLFSLLLFFL